MIGKTISRYRILEKIGEGGMGVVFKAEDTRLERMVALKFLTPQAIGGEEDRARFVHEAKAAASLDHSSICTVYEVDEAEDKTFIAMAYIEGVSLRDRVESGPLSLGEAMDMAVQIGEGLHEAHEKGIVHRDIKPANVMVTPNGQAKITDFGLAKSAKGTAHTKTGTTIGTVAYMSPEQARGEDVDRRTDIWSLGAVLYELVTGHKPFKGDYEHAVVYSILNQEPEPITALKPGLPAELERIVHKAMAKDVDERYQHMADFLVDMRSLRSRLSAGESAPRSVKTGLSGRSRALVYASIAAFLIVLVATNRSLFKGAPAAIDSIAVLPLENMSEDPGQDYFADGMTEELIGTLANIGALKVISRTSVMRYKQTDKALPDIAGELGVAAIVEGSVQRVGDKVRISAQLIEGKTDRHLWAGSYERDVSDVLALQSEVARAIAQEIKVKLTSHEESQLTRATSVDPRAYEAYLMGRYHWNRRTEESLMRGIEYFESAIDTDPGYALAYVGLAEALIALADWLYIPAAEAYPRAREIATRALEIDEGLAEAHTALADVRYMYDWDWAGSEAEFKRAIELKPNYATAHQWYSEYLTSMGRNDEALIEIDRALELDPLSLIAQSVKGYILYHAGQVEGALEQYRRIFEMDPSYVPAHLMLMSIYLSEGRIDEGVEELEQYLVHSGVPEGEIVTMREAYQTSGLGGACQWMIDRAQRVAQERHVSPIFFALWYAYFDKDKAFEWLEKACEERAAILAWMKADHRFKPLRSDPRYAEIVRKIGLDE